LGSYPCRSSPTDSDDEADFLVANKDPFIRAHFSERRLRPLTLLDSDEEKIKQFQKIRSEVPTTSIAGIGIRV